jgi:hypothetical protein
MFSCGIPRAEIGPDKEREKSPGRPKGVSQHLKTPDAMLGNREEFYLGSHQLVAAEFGRCSRGMRL